MPPSTAYRNNVKEQDYFIKSDGTSYLLGDTKTRTVFSIEGQGTPPIEYITDRAPYQDGETVRGNFLRPRMLQYVIRQKFCDRAGYWNGRAALLDAIRPNRGVGVLRKVLSTGAYRDLYVYISEGPNWTARNINAWDEWAFGEVVRFIAHNPVAFDPVQKALTLGAATTGFVFPITFPVVFNGFNINGSITYLGTWPEYPTIILTGPMSFINITNVTTGQVIGLTYPIPFGYTATISLQPGAKSITLSDGTDLMPYLASNSNISSFKLQPGVNQILASVSGDGASTAVQITYYNRYFGF